MPSQDINIRLRLTDEATTGLNKAQNAIQKLHDSTKQLALEMRKVGRQLSYVGMSMNMLGASLTAPLILAYKEAGKFNAEIAHQLNQTKNVFQNLAVSIGTSLLPVMRQLTNEVAIAVNWWNNLDKNVRDRVVQSVFILGRNFILLGTSMVIVGKSISTLANLLLLLSAICTPMGLVVTAVSAGFIGLSIAIWKCKPVADAVSVAFAELTRILSGGLINLKPMALSEGIDAAKKQVDEFMDVINQLRDAIKNAGNLNLLKPEGNFLTGFKFALRQSIDALQSWRDMGIQAGMDLAQGLQDNFKNIFLDAFHGQLKKAQDYFAAFGNMILNIFADVCSKIITQWIETMIITGLSKKAVSVMAVGAGMFSPVSGASGIGASSGSVGGVAVTGSLGGISYHRGGLVRAHSGLAIDEVPIIAQSGERVLSRKQNREYESGGGRQQPTVIVIQAWDTQDIMRNRKSIEGIIINALKSNSGVRGAIKTYG